jgi:hypothetical protein
MRIEGVPPGHPVVPAVDLGKRHELLLGARHPTGEAGLQEAAGLPDEPREAVQLAALRVHGAAYAV